MDSSEHDASNSSRYVIASPQLLRAENRRLKNEHYILTRELREIVDPLLRQRTVREIAAIETQLMARGVFV